MNQLRPTSQGPQPGPRLRLLVHVADNGADLAQDIGPTKPRGQNDNGAPRKKDGMTFFVVAGSGGCNPFFVCCNEFLKGPLKGCLGDFVGDGIFPRVVFFSNGSQTKAIDIYLQ